MIEKEILKKIILEQKNLFENKKYIKRDKEDILRIKSKSDLIIIITGIRRSGKSVLLSNFKKTQKEKNYYINFDDDRLNNFKVEDFERLYEVFLELFGKENTFYFDEIQNIEGWEKFVRRLNDYKNKIYITGSNANLLSNELGTHLTGRYVPIELFPANFKEFLDFNKIKFKESDFYNREKIVLFQKYFQLYIKKGGFLKYLEFEDIDFFKTLFDNIIYRDIIARYNLSYKKGLKDIVYYLISNISKEFNYSSLKSISNISSISTIKEYIEYLENSYLIFTITKYDYSLKKQLINPKKVYVIDSGLANSISFKFSEERGRILENIVFIELKRRGKEIYYHKNKNECDFIIKEGSNIVQAIQVCKTLINGVQNIETKNREIEGLVEACKSYNLNEGIILTEDEEGEEILEIKDNNKNLEKKEIKIKIIPIWKWILSKN